MIYVNGGYTRMAQHCFAPREGWHWGETSCNFCCTNGGAKQLGQVMRYAAFNLWKVNVGESSWHQGRLAVIFLESGWSKSLFNFGEQFTSRLLAILWWCEDQYTKVVDKSICVGGYTQGTALQLLRVYIYKQNSLALVFSTGWFNFVCEYFNSPAKTIAISGPWGKFKRSVIWNLVWIKAGHPPFFS